MPKINVNSPLKIPSPLTFYGYTPVKTMQTWLGAGSHGQRHFADFPHYLFV